MRSFARGTLRRIPALTGAAPTLTPPVPINRATIKIAEEHRWLGQAPALAEPLLEIFPITSSRELDHHQIRAAHPGPMTTSEYRRVLDRARDFPLSLPPRPSFALLATIAM